MDASSTPALQYLHPDALGSSPLSTAPSGDPAALVDQDPYGLRALEKLPGDSPLPSRSFTGKELDPSQWYYFGARYFSPEMARFTQVDPVTLGLGRMRPAELQTILADPFRYLNPYAYASNNPLKYVDEDGNISMYVALKNFGDFSNGVRLGWAERTLEAYSATANLIAHPIQGGKAIGAGVADIAKSGADLASDLAANPGQVAREFVQGVKISAQEFAQKDPFEQGRSTGHVGGDATILGLTGAVGAVEGTGIKVVNTATKKAVQAQVGNINVAAETYGGAGGGGVTVRNTNLPGGWYNQRIAGIDLHRVGRSAWEKIQPYAWPTDWNFHLHIEIGPLAGKHLPWDLFKR